MSAREYEGRCIIHRITSYVLILVGVLLLAFLSHIDANKTPHAIIMLPAGFLCVLGGVVNREFMEPIKPS